MSSKRPQKRLCSALIANPFRFHRYLRSTWFTRARRGPRASGAPPGRLLRWGRLRLGRGGAVSRVNSSRTAWPSLGPAVGADVGTVGQESFQGRRQRRAFKVEPCETSRRAWAAARSPIPPAECPGRTRRLPCRPAACPPSAPAPCNIACRRRRPLKFAGACPALAREGSRSLTSPKSDNRNVPSPMMRTFAGLMSPMQDPELVQVHDRFGNGPELLLDARAQQRVLPGNRPASTSRSSSRRARSPPRANSMAYQGYSRPSTTVLPHS